MPGRRLDFDRAFDDWAEEADVDRLAEGRHPVAKHRERGCARADALDQAGDHATVQGAEGLAELLANLQPNACVLRVVVEPLGSYQRVERGARRLWLDRHSGADPIGSCAAVGFSIHACGALETVPGLMPLDADQKAMLRLLAQREQGYEDIGALMGLSIDEVRKRVREALAELDRTEGSPQRATTEPKPERASPAAEPERRSRLATEAARESNSAPSAGQAEGEPSPPRPATRREPLSSRLRGARMPKDRRRAFELLGGVVLIALVVLFATGAIDIGGGGSSSSGSNSSASEAARPENPRLTQAILKPVNGGEASGRALFGRIGKKVALQVEAEGLEQPPRGQSYVIWLAKSSKVMVPVTPVEVGKSGQIAVQYPLPAQVIGYLAGAAFDEIDISLVSAPLYRVALAKARKAGKPPTYTGTDVLRGPITGPIVGAALKQSKSR